MRQKLDHHKNVFSVHLHFSKKKFSRLHFRTEFRTQNTFKFKKILSVLKDFRALLDFDKIGTNNTVFKLHYQFTVNVLLVFSVLIGLKQYFGDAISCSGINTKGTFRRTIC